MVTVGLTKVCGVCRLNNLFGIHPRHVSFEPGVEVPELITVKTKSAGTETCKPVMRATGAFRLSAKGGHLCSTDHVGGFDVLEG